MRKASVGHGSVLIGQTHVKKNGDASADDGRRVDERDCFAATDKPQDSRCESTKDHGQAWHLKCGRSGQIRSARGDHLSGGLSDQLRRSFAFTIHSFCRRRPILKLADIETTQLSLSPDRGIRYLLLAGEDFPLMDRGLYALQQLVGFSIIVSKSAIGSATCTMNYAYLI